MNILQQQHVKTGLCLYHVGVLEKKEGGVGGEEENEEEDEEE